MRRAVRVLGVLVILGPATTGWAEQDERRASGAAAPIDISKAVAAFAPGWAVRDCGNAMEPGLRDKWGGRANVLVTHPLNVKTPCVLSRSGKIQPGKKTSLELTVCNDSRGDWDLVVRADEREVFREMIGGSDWRDISIDISKYGGKTVNLTLFNQPTGWMFEAAYWSKIAIETEVENAWQPIGYLDVGGLLGERLALWRNERLWYMADDGYLLSGFESRPGVHPWQGEHVGKWLHAATLAHQQTSGNKLARKLHETAERLVAAQETNGYLGTYAEEKRFYTVPADKRSWDVWSHRYNIYGLLTYERFHADPHIVSACERMGDLLIKTYGPGGADLTQSGTRKGISSSTLLESIMMLYERTQEEHFLKFAEHIVACSESNDGLRLMGAMLNEEDISGPGEGKAYQLMANQSSRPYESKITCCASSGPRALEMFSQHLAGEMEAGIALSSLVPGSVSLPSKLGNAHITITGGSPVKPRMEIRFDAINDKTFPIYFRTPAGARLKSVQVNGETVAPSATDRGFQQITRQWKKGDTVAIVLEYLLDSQILFGQDRKKWIAFTYGPWALAQEIQDGLTLEEPFKGLDVQSTDPLSLLWPIDRLDAEPGVRIKGSGITLVPYFMAGSKTTGTRTYFEL
ncbi:MAG: glycoside hydrolase family 127 protein [Phycisphaerae bacterium]|nr:glycoside hydrolase family 127 protein [Phycisphaerae bacterium]